MTPAARLQSAITLLEEMAADGGPADAVASAFFRTRRYIGAADRREVSALVWQVLRSWFRVSWWIDRVGLVATAPLRLAAFLVLDGWTLDRLAHCYDGERYAPAPIEPADRVRLERLSGVPLTTPQMDEASRLEVPAWLLGRLRARFGDALEAEMNAALAEAPLDLRVNLLQGTRDDAAEALRAEGFAPVETPQSHWGLRIRGRRPVTSGAAFKSGLVEVQDEGSQLLARLVDARPEMRVVDYCAGAGGKTLALAMCMTNRGHIVACDVSAPRLARATERLRRAGVHNAECHLLVPGDKWAKRRAGTFDRVLVDAPCTGTGTWRRNPDARLRLREQDLAELLVKQSGILQAAAGLVKPGGRLIYATCSLLVEENEAQVDAFIDRSPNFRRGAVVSLTPLRDGTDGFFGAVLERAA